MSAARGGIYELISRNRGRLAMAVLLVACVYFLVTFATQAWRANRLEAEIAGQRAAIADIRRENAALATQAAMLNSPAYAGYVERVARRDLGLARPGETVLLVPRQQAAVPTPAPTEQPQPDERQNWQRWIDAILDPE
ncbi:MAG TPA: septum formation initiator family protein [Thermomicrobiales bacterium]|nr:septum formation initiator family protein [Thermomicrobiales bacterium]